MKFLLLSLLTIAFHISYGATVDTITIQSKALQSATKCVVVIPDDYYESQNQEFPVVYLLHGYTGDYSNWITRVPEIKHYAEAFEIILVCPDAKNSWYINSPVIPGSQYESYIAEELPRNIDSLYRTIPQREFRAITGLSMGGHGALYLAFRHPDVFGAAGSMSGVLDLVPWKDGYGIERLIGDTTAAAIARYSDIHLIARIPPDFPIIIDCGIDDPFIEANRRMHAALIKKGIPHDYIERDGGHNWAYWSNAVAYQLLFFRLGFDGNMASALKDELP